MTLEDPAAASGVGRSTLEGVFLEGRAQVGGGLVDLLFEAEARDPDRVHLRSAEGGATTVGELADRARRWATVLQGRGLGAGDRLAFVCGNDADVIALQFGTYMCGAIEVPINSELRGEMLRMIVADADPALVIVEDLLVDAVREHLPAEIDLLVLGKELRAEAEAAAPIAEPARPGPSHLALILYTSGTSGPSKGVMLTHAYLPNCAASWAAALRITADDTFYAPTPFFHVDIHVLNAMCLLYSATLGYARRFSVSRFWSETGAMGATVFLAVGAMAAALVARRPETAPEHGFRAAIVAPIPDEVFEYFEDELGITLIQLYGQTEADHVVFNTLDRRSRGGAGWACCGFDVRVVDEDDEPVPIGTTGRIVYRPKESNMMTVGYWRRPEATAEACRNLWWHTGDLGHLDEDEFLWFDGRASDSLRRRGENISSWELEVAVAAAPGLKTVAAVAAPDEIGGEDEIQLFVSLEDGPEWDPRAFFEYCGANLPRFAQPSQVIVIEDAAFVRGPGTGAIQKHLLGPHLAYWQVDRADYLD
jgi:crotonobetaine/carnitine-CoA ligase